MQRIRSRTLFNELHMVHYIDADKLIAEIERLKKHSQEAKMEFIDEGYNQNAFAEDCRIVSFDKLLSFISSLQQEQPEVDLDEEIDNYLYPKGFVRDLEGIHVGGVCMRDWKGFNKKWIEKRITPEQFRNFARHFISLSQRSMENNS